MLPRRAIQTERLALVPAAVSGAPAMLAAVQASVKDLRQWMAWAESATLETTLASLSHAERAWVEGTAYGFAVTRAGELLGRVDIRRTAHDPGEGNLGFWMTDAAAGRGFMTEAVSAVVEFGFQALRLGRIELRAHVDNIASQRVAEKSGMRREGRARGGTWLGRRGSQDAYLYGMIASDPRRDTGQASARPRGAPVVAQPDFARGLVTAVAQDQADGAVLMVAQMNQEAYARTLASGHAWFWSRSRERLWEKGETSGNHLVVSRVTLDCDGDAVLLGVAPAGPACHTGARTCFHNPVVVAGGPGAVDKVAQRQARDPKSEQ